MIEDGVEFLGDEVEDKSPFRTFKKAVYSPFVNYMVKTGVRDEAMAKSILISFIIIALAVSIILMYIGSTYQRELENEINEVSMLIF